MRDLVVRGVQWSTVYRSGAVVKTTQLAVQALVSVLARLLPPSTSSLADITTHITVPCTGRQPRISTEHRAIDIPLAKMAVAPLLKRPFDLLMVVYFVSHIPTTLFVDSQASA